MSEYWYTAVERFGPECGERWLSYTAWIGLPELRGVVTLDGILCPSAIGDLTIEDWEHNVSENGCVEFFRSLDYLLARPGPSDGAGDGTAVLALVREPLQEQADRAPDPRFIFYGYDVVERGSTTSAITNCGGFEAAYRRDELSDFGLLETLDRARDVRDALRRHYPGEPHADCQIWALWRLDRPSG